MIVKQFQHMRLRSNIFYDFPQHIFSVDDSNNCATLQQLIDMADYRGLTSVVLLVYALLVFFICKGACQAYNDTSRTTTAGGVARLSAARGRP